MVVFKLLLLANLAWAHPVMIGPATQGEALTFTNFEWHDVNLDGAQFPANIWRGFNLDHVQAQNFNLKQSQLLGGFFTHVRFANSDLRGVRMSHLKAHNWDLRTSRIDGMHLTFSNIRGSDLRAASLQSVYVADTIFEDCILPVDFKSKAILVNVKFIRTRFEP